MKQIPCEVYTRVVGYYRPVQNWNQGKAAEFVDRKEFDETASMKSPVPDTKQIPAPQNEQLVEGVSAGSLHEVSGDCARYEIYTLPNCEKCETVKRSLSSRSLVGAEFDLSDSEGKSKVRQVFKSYRDRIQRNADGTLPLPLVLLYNENDELENIVQTPEELERIA